MTPDKQPIDWWVALIGLALGRAAEKFEGLTHKQVIAIAAAIICGLCGLIVMLLQFGFASMQTNFSEVKSSQVEFAKEMKTYQDKQAARDLEQDKCLVELKTFIRDIHPEGAKK